MDHKAKLESFAEGIFAIQGSLDGERLEEYTEKEQFIGLIIGEEEFFLPISLINEIIMLLPITYVPQSSPYIEGVFNLRGTILPAINLRKMMGVRKGGATPASRIIIVYVGEHIVGILVDAITYVTSLHPSQIESQTLPGKSVGSELISKISKNGEKITGILDIDKIVQVTQKTSRSSEIIEQKS